MFKVRKISLDIVTVYCAYIYIRYCVYSGRLVAEVHFRLNDVFVADVYK